MPEECQALLLGSFSHIISFNPGDRFVKSLCCSHSADKETEVRGIYNLFKMIQLIHYRAYYALKEKYSKSFELKTFPSEVLR